MLMLLFTCNQPNQRKKWQTNTSMNKRSFHKKQVINQVIREPRLIKLIRLWCLFVVVVGRHRTQRT